MSCDNETCQDIRVQLSALREERDALLDERHNDTKPLELVTALQNVKSLEKELLDTQKSLRYAVAQVQSLKGGGSDGMARNRTQI